jgi:hypothetical protein
MTTPTQTNAGNPSTYAPVDLMGSNSIDYSSGSAELPVIENSFDEEWNIIQEGVENRISPDLEDMFPHGFNQSNTYPSPQNYHQNLPYPENGFNFDTLSPSLEVEQGLDSIGQQHNPMNGLPSDSSNANSQGPNLGFNLNPYFQPPQSEQVLDTIVQPQHRKDKPLLQSSCPNSQHSNDSFSIPELMDFLENKDSTHQPQHLTQSGGTYSPNHYNNSNISTMPQSLDPEHVSNAMRQPQGAIGGNIQGNSHFRPQRFDISIGSTSYLDGMGSWQFGGAMSQPQSHMDEGTQYSAPPYSHNPLNDFAVNTDYGLTEAGQLGYPIPLPQNPILGHATLAIDEAGLAPVQEELAVSNANLPQIESHSPHMSSNDLHLNREVRRQPRKRGTNKPQPSPNGVQKRTKRRAKVENFDPRLHYERIIEIPHPWLGMDIEYQYNKYGELSAETFTHNQIFEYLYFHPRQAGLTLWIQTTPSDSKARYPNKNSSKCRFKDCPDKKKMIRKGFFRVAFDEHYTSGRRLDPYHCAGFVHLYCLEKLCDFPALCQGRNVQPDDRRFPEKNRMAITRDHEEMLEVVNTFIRSPPAKSKPFNYEESLSYQLTKRHLELEPSVRQSTRSIRGGNHIGLHMGNVDKYATGEEQKWARKRLEPPRPRKSSKRKRTSNQEEEGSSNGETEENDQSHQNKRIRRMS